jgi:S-adenosylmethionine:tRNA ribosyltransferase-isomerase
MVIDRTEGTIEHHIFRDLPQFLTAGDALVLNETRVVPARLHIIKAETGGKGELLLLERIAPNTWKALVGGSGMRVGVHLRIEDGLRAEIIEQLDGGHRVVRFNRPVSPILDQIGETPLPPYIRTPIRSPEEYQTVFAQYSGSVAAPTAGLHFTPELLNCIESSDVSIVTLTLHIGLDTFLPVTVENPLDHTIHSEWCHLSERAAATINAVSAAGGRVIAVGTTTVRTLESAAHVASDGERVGPIEGPTDLFILPGYPFKAVDALVTNFHLPRSTLLMMVSAFLGRERTLQVYEVAKGEGYRFYSFGDAMLIL